MKATERYSIKSLFDEGLVEVRVTEVRKNICGSTTRRLVLLKKPGINVRFFKSRDGQILVGYPDGKNLYAVPENKLIIQQPA